VLRKSIRTKVFQNIKECRIIIDIDFYTKFLEEKYSICCSIEKRILIEPLPEDLPKTYFQFIEMKAMNVMKK
jgi:hypothetical protein